MSSEFKNIAVIGLGLLGGSLCRALKKREGVGISAFGRDESRLKPAMDDGVIDRAGPMEQLDLSGSDLVVVSVPVTASISVIRNILVRPDLGPDAIVIDVGSVKGSLCRGIEDIPGAARFIGCHPMVGSEKMGYRHSSGSLYENAWVIITPANGNNNEDIERIGRFWRELGARTVIVEPETHDLLVAYTSHLPHIISCVTVEALMKFLDESGIDRDITPFIGQGFRDVTRVAAGSPDMWREILENNSVHIADAARSSLEGMERLLELLLEKNSDMEKIGEYFSKIKKFRESL